jgi:hypothetical protein
MCFRVPSQILSVTFACTTKSLRIALLGKIVDHDKLFDPVAHFHDCCAHINA